MKGDYIKVNRSMLEWEWYSDINTTRLFIHLILKANWKDGNFRGTTVPRGSLITSIRKLAEETNLTEREIRTAISHLKSTGEVTHKGHTKYSVFTVINYDRYQYTDTQVDNQETNERQTNDKRTTTIEERKKGRREEGNINNTVRFTPPEIELVREYCLERKNSVDAQAFIDFYSSKGWMIGKNKMKDWKAAVRTWEKNRTGGTSTKPVSKNLNNFERRKYDMDSLEEQLLGR